MIEDWFSAIELPLTWQQFWQLPRNPAYKYEYFDGRGWLSPRPKSYHAVLDLQAFARPIADMATDDTVVVRPLQDADWKCLPKLFAAAFDRVQPFASLTDEERLTAAGDCLSHTRGSGEGPLVGEASLVAARDGTLVGANLITLLPGDASKHAAGLPHLTWIFVAPFYSRQGLGMALLDMAVKALLRLGYKELASTFLLGNESSMLWHWRAGFRVPEQPWSTRAGRKEARAGDVQSRAAGARAWTPMP
jgi:GNAT superfamily N-acetyltransferase